MFSWLFGKSKNSKELAKLYLARISFLMEYAQQHVFKDKHDVVKALNKELLLEIPENLQDPENRIWPDPSNNNLAVSFNCSDRSNPNKVDQFIIIGFEELANTLVIGSAHESGIGKLMWNIKPESNAREIPAMSKTVQEALWHMPGWKVLGVAHIRFLLKE